VTDDIMLHEVTRSRGQVHVADRGPNSELRHVPPTAAHQTPPVASGNGETGTGKRFRHHVTSSAAGGRGQLERQIVRTLSRVCEALERGESRLEREEFRTSNRVAWQYVSLVVDRLLLMLFTVGTISITLGILLHAPLSRYYLFASPRDDDDVVHGESAVTDPANDR